MSTKVRICVIRDEKYKLGITSEKEGNFWSVDQDSIIGDIVYDDLSNLLALNPSFTNPWHGRIDSDRQKLDSKIERAGLNLIPQIPEAAIQLKKWCAKHFRDQYGLVDLEFEIVYHDSLEDAGHFNLDKAVIL